MKLIIDSGSTKTDWIAIDGSNNILLETHTLGLNPQVLTEAIIEERIINNYDLYRVRNDVDSIHFYGAGCGTEPPRKLMGDVLKSIFQKIHPEKRIERKHGLSQSCGFPSTI